MSALKNYIHDVPDFPKPGVTFRDITPLLGKRFAETIEQMAALLDDVIWNDAAIVAGVDARGFLFASALAMHKNKCVAIIRKAGKLPPPVVTASYALEYGEDVLQMKPGNGNLILIDDVLATGGTLQASANLCSEAGYNVIALATLIDLRFLNDFSWNGLKVQSLVQYDN